MKTRLVRVVVLAMVGVAASCPPRGRSLVNPSRNRRDRRVPRVPTETAHRFLRGQGHGRVTATGTSPTVVTFTWKYPTGLTLNKVMIQATPYAYSGREATNAYPCGN